MSDNLIPFGKYKGQPVEILETDPKYREWLAAQTWVKEKHQNFYNIVINNHAEPQETPEHNRLQAKFLDEAFCLKVLKRLHFEEKLRLDMSYKETGQHKWMITKPAVNFEESGFDAVISLQGRWASLSDERRHSETITLVALVEMKPVVSDDYAAVLRQTKTARQVWGSKPRNRSGYSLCVVPAVVIDNFQSEAIDREQLRKIFASSAIQVVFLDEVQ